MLKLFLWLRYLRKKKIVFLSIAAVALSVALLIVVASLFTGFINVFEQSAVDILGDVVLVAPIKFAKYPLFIERLERDGELVRVSEPVSTFLEMTEIQTRLLKQGGPAVLFENPVNERGEPSDIPVLVNLFGTVKRVAMAVTLEGKERTEAHDLRDTVETVGLAVALNPGGYLFVDAEAPFSDGGPDLHC